MNDHDFGLPGEAYIAVGQGQDNKRIRGFMYKKNIMCVRVSWTQNMDLVQSEKRREDANIKLSPPRTHS